MGAESAKESMMDYVNLTLWYVFILLSSLMLLNMLIGILCEVITAVAESEKEGIEVDYAHDNIKQIYEVFLSVERGLGAKSCTHVNDGGDVNMVSKEAFLGLVQMPEMTELLQDVGVDTFGITELVDVLFTDDNGDPLELCLAELIVVLLNHRDSKTITVQDITNMRKYVTAKLVRWKKALQGYSERDTDLSATLTAQLRTLGDMLERVKDQKPGTFQQEVRAYEKVLRESKKAKKVEMAMLKTGAVTRLASKLVSQRHSHSNQAKSPGQEAKLMPVVEGEEPKEFQEELPAVQEVEEKEAEEEKEEEETNG